MLPNERAHNRRRLDPMHRLGLHPSLGVGDIDHAGAHIDLDALSEHVPSPPHRRVDPLATSMITP